MGYLELGILFVGSVGLALLLGTAAALARFRRTGTFPGQPDDLSDVDTERAVRAARSRMLLGAALAVAGAATLIRVMGNG